MELEGQNVNIPLRGFFADPEVLDVFEFELEHGDKATELKEPYSVVLTKKAALKLFKDENPVGLTFKVGDIGIYTVTGFLKETNSKSHIVFEGLASMATVASLRGSGNFPIRRDSWSNFWDGWTYVLIDAYKSSTDIKSHLDKINKAHCIDPK